MSLCQVEVASTRSNKPPPSMHRAGCAVEIRELPLINSEKETQLFELKTGGKMEAMKSGVCLDVDAKDKLQLVNGRMGKKYVEVLCDTSCTRVLIKRDLLNQGELTGEKGYVTTGDGVEYSTSEYEYEYCKKLRVRVRVLILKNVLEYEYRKKVRVRVRVLLQV